LNKFGLCELEPNITCDMDYNCLNCVKQENRWAEIWVNGPVKGAEADAGEGLSKHVSAKKLAVS